MQATGVVQFTSLSVHSHMFAATGAIAATRSGRYAAKS